jgi:hypothetical protein
MPRLAQWNNIGIRYVLIECKLSSQPLLKTKRFLRHFSNTQRQLKYILLHKSLIQRQNGGCQAVGSAI